MGNIRVLEGSPLQRQPGVLSAYAQEASVLPGRLEDYPGEGTGVRVVHGSGHLQAVSPRAAADGTCVGTLARPWAGFPPCECWAVSRAGEEEGAAVHTNHVTPGREDRCALRRTWGTGVEHRSLRASACPGRALLWLVLPMRPSV